MNGFLESPFAPLVLRPAFDRVAVPALARVYFPLSRLWALALADPGDAGTLLAAVPALERRRAKLVRAIAAAQARARAWETAERRWREGLFAAGGASQAELMALETDRAAAAQALMAARLRFLPFLRAAPVAPLGWRVAPPTEVEARHRARLDGPDAAFAVAGPPPGVQLSRAVAADGVETRWLRAPATVAGKPDSLWARIERPLGAAGGPTLIFTHGIAMETEFWRGTSSIVTGLVRAGVTVIRPEGPWHGRRRPPSRFGGEPALARGPMGLLDYFDAHVCELGALTAWARARFAGPVALGGVSLGALTAQMALAAARHWTAACRPDAGFLVTTSGALRDVSLAGSLTRAIGLPQQLAQAGWDDAALARWLPLLDPGAPCVAPARVVAVLGATDEVTPYPGGRALAAAWGVPADNLFVARRGHFSAALGLYRARAPLRRLVEILAAA